MHGGDEVLRDRLRAEFSKLNPNINAPTDDEVKVCLIDTGHYFNSYYWVAGVAGSVTAMREKLNGQVGSVGRKHPITSGRRLS